MRDFIVLLVLLLHFEDRRYPFRQGAQKSLLGFRGGFLKLRNAFLENEKICEKNYAEHDSIIAEEGKVVLLYVFHKLLNANH